jgi:uncharacterized RDD family membrane protein YckC
MVAGKLLPNEEKKDMESSIQPNIQKAGAGRRFVNFIVDLLLIEILLIFIVDPIISATLGENLKTYICLPFLIGLFLQYLYYFLFEALMQKTPAKIINRTKVVGLDGLKADVRAIAIRSFIRFIPFDPLSIYTGKEETNRSTWWHDRWSKTRVVLG